jgi:UDP-hydrolysing UDP-N-acetyl-D-glucosamine 2-epimerase
VKRVCVVVGSRANYSSIKAVLRAVEAHPELELQLVVAASALLDRYGAVADLIAADGFEATARVFMLVEGETPLTMAKSTGVGLMELPTILENLGPDVVVTVGDRFETMATTLASAYMNIPVAHTMGGEVSGSIDESIRHAITKLAHVHFPASRDAYERIVRLGEDPESVHLVGCPRIDLVAEQLERPPQIDRALLEGAGVGDAVSVDDEFILVSQHPVTSEYGQSEEQMEATLEAVARVGMPAIVLWPNADAGSDDTARAIRRRREQARAPAMRFFKNLPIATYTDLMRTARCLVGNSSSGIREGAFIGTPVVNIGTRQHGRERGPNVLDVAHDASEIEAAIRKQSEHRRYERADTYGDGFAGGRIAAVLATGIPARTQKSIQY